MSNKGLLSGWGLALLLTILATVQYGQLRDLRHDLQQEQDRRKTQAAIHNNEAVTFEQTIANLRKNLQQARQDLYVAINDVPETADDNPARQEPVYAEQQPAAITRIMDSPRVRELSSKMMLNARYGRFIDTLGLSSAEREELEGTLGDILARQNELRIQLATGDISIELFQEEMRFLSVEDAFTNFLTSEELDAYYVYQEQEQDRMRQQAETAMNMQLTMQTPGLTPENRAKLAEVLSRELGAIRTGPGIRAAGAGFIATDVGAGASTGPTVAFMGNQPEMYDRIRDELAGSMDDGQMAIVDGYLKQQQMQMQMIQEVMSAGGGPDGPGRIMVTP